MDLFSLRLLKLDDEYLGWVLPFSVVLNIFEFLPHVMLQEKKGNGKTWREDPGPFQGQVV